MSCGLPIRSISRCAFAFAFVLFTAGAPSAVFSQSPDCHLIRSGETATRLARRITGDGRNAYAAWFQIKDDSSRFVPKSQYDRIRGGWYGCIVKDSTENPIEPAAELTTPAAVEIAFAAPPVTPTNVTVGNQPLTAATVARSIGGSDLRVLWLVGALVLPLVGWRALDDYARRRDLALVVMRQFGQEFVREFERPLLQEESERPVRWRLRLSPARARMEILLAPGQGRRYPNLADHKSNLEYDVVRVQRLIADDAFERGTLHVDAGWVVVPFRFKVKEKKQTGVA